MHTFYFTGGGTLGTAARLYGGAAHDYAVEVNLLEMKMPQATSRRTLNEGSIVAESAEKDARVYVIDDESEVRRSLHFLLSTAGLVSWPFASAADFLDNLETLEPAPILLDIRLPDIDGVQLMQALLDRAIQWPVIVMTAHGDIPVAVKVIKMGAIDFLEKPFEFETLESCLEIAFARLAEVKQAVARQNTARSLFAQLSPRETEVVSVLMQGIPNKNAAQLLSLSVRTVEMHRANALGKLAVKSIAEVVRLAHDAGLDSAPAIKADLHGQE